MSHFLRPAGGSVTVKHNSHNHVISPMTKHLGALSDLDQIEDIRLFLFPYYLYVQKLASLA